MQCVSSSRRCPGLPESPAWPWNAVCYGLWGAGVSRLWRFLASFCPEHRQVKCKRSEDLHLLRVGKGTGSASKNRKISRLSGGERAVVKGSEVTVLLYFALLRLAPGLGLQSNTLLEFRKRRGPHAGLGEALCARDFVIIRSHLPAQPVFGTLFSASVGVPRGSCSTS